MELLQQLETLLQSDPISFARESLSQWQAMAGCERPPFVIYGAGHLGQRVTHALLEAHLTVLALCDADPSKQGTTFEGIPVLSPEEATQRHGQTACFVVCVWRAEGIPHRFTETRSRLHALGANHVAQFGHLARLYLPELLPHYAIDQPINMLKDQEDILQAAHIWADETSQDRYLRHVLWRLSLNFDLLPQTDPGEIYFPEDLMPPGDAETIVDAGAFDGDTILLAHAKWPGKICKFHAFEPDPTTAEKLRNNVRKVPVPVNIHECALGERNCNVKFQALGELYSAPGAGDCLELPCRLLDDVLETEHVTFIKMDIEGGELAALQGARKLLSRCRPRLAICLYHRQDHPWRIPLFLHQALPGYEFHLRDHGTDGWELVLYAFPRL